MLIAQITDLHIVEPDRHWLQEPLTATATRLHKVVAYLNALDPKPDLVLITGDIVDNGLETSYIHARNLLEVLTIPFYVIPGNHDHRETMRRIFSTQPNMPAFGFLQYTIDDYPLRLIGLDTLVEGQDFGTLCQERLLWLETTLRTTSHKPTLLFMHHPPGKIGIKLFDHINCRVTPDFEVLIQNTPQVIGILTGHYHHLCMSSFGQKLCFLAPSVAPVHYISHPDNMYVSALELEDPAITLHHWTETTPLVTHVRKIKDRIQRIDWPVLQDNTCVSK